MPISRWFTWIWGWACVLWLGTAASAMEPGRVWSGNETLQAGGIPLPAYYGGDRPAAAGWGGQAVYGNVHDGMNPPPGMVPQGMAPIPPGYPSPMQPWPEISPYEHRFDQTRLEDGLWFRHTDNSPAEWVFGVELLLQENKRPGHRQIGNQAPFPGGRVADLGRLRQRDFTTPGVQPYFGKFDVDDSGFLFSAFYAPQVGQKLDFTNIIELPVTILLKDANPLTYDTSIIVEYDNFAYGAELQWFTTPVMGSELNKVRAIYGVRYFGTTEEMTVSLFDTTIGSTVIQSDTRAFLVGPEVGLRWDLGGEKFKVYTVGKFGLLANFQRLDLVYNNWSGNTGHLREYHTNAVPMLDLGIFTEFPLFRHIPLIKRIPYVREGIFRFGWNYTGLFFMARPAEDIRWELAHPRLKVNHTTFDIRQFHFGIEWNW